MVRTDVYLDSEQERALAYLAAKQKCTLAEVIRQAVDAYVKARVESDDDAGRERLDEFLVGQLA